MFEKVVKKKKKEIVNSEHLDPQTLENEST